MEGINCMYIANFLLYNTITILTFKRSFISHVFADNRQKRTKNYKIQQCRPLMHMCILNIYKLVPANILQLAMQVKYIWNVLLWFIVIQTTVGVSSTSFYTERERKYFISINLLRAFRIKNKVNFFFAIIRFLFIF